MNNIKIVNNFIYFIPRAHELALATFLHYSADFSSDLNAYNETLNYKLTFNPVELSCKSII
jgi:hypothetical protein